jgi:hypothetical protein
MPLLTVDALRDHYPSIFGPDDVPEVERVIRRAESLAVGWCGWPAAASSFELATYTEYFAGPDGLDWRSLMLGVPYAHDIVAVDIAADWDYAAGESVDLSTLALDGPFLYRAEPWPSLGPRSIRVQYRAGLDASSPRYDATVLALAHFARHLWLLRTGAGVEQFSMTGQSVSRPGMSAAVPSEVQTMLTAAGLVNWGGRLG